MPLPVLLFFGHGSLRRLAVRVSDQVLRGFLLFSAARSGGSKAVWSHAPAFFTFSFIGSSFQGAFAARLRRLLRRFGRS